MSITLEDPLDSIGHRTLADPPSSSPTAAPTDHPQDQPQTTLQPSHPPHLHSHPPATQNIAGRTSPDPSPLPPATLDKPDGGEGGSLLLTSAHRQPKQPEPSIASALPSAVAGHPVYSFASAAPRPPKRPKIDHPPRAASPELPSRSAPSPSVSSLSFCSSPSSSPSEASPPPGPPSQSTPDSQPHSPNQTHTRPSPGPSQLAHGPSLPSAPPKHHPPSLSGSPGPPEKAKAPCTIDLTEESPFTQASSTSTSSHQPPSALLHQKIKFGSRQQALALSQAILRRQAEQRDQPPRSVTHSNGNPPIKTPYAHLNVPSGRQPPQHLAQPPRLQPSSQPPGRRHYPSWTHRSAPNVSPAGQIAHAPLASPTFNNGRPICIGLLSSLVLILYRLKEFEIDLCGPDGKVRPQTLPVRLCRFPPNGTNEILKVLSPTGEQFGVVEHKTGNVIGPLLGPVHSISGGSAVGGWTPKPSSQAPDTIPSPHAAPAPPPGQSRSSDANENDIVEISRPGGSKVPRPPFVPASDGRQLFIECCVIRRGEQNPMMLPLQLLLFCLPDAVSSIAAYLSRCLVTLEHPVSYHPEMHLGCLYDNPHSCQPREAMESIRQRLLGSSGCTPNHQVLHPTAPPCDNQQQVATIFKSLASGVDLDETEPGDLIVTPLYPHQKQALSFMLDRETLKAVPEDTKSSGSITEKKALEKEDEENLVSLWKKTRDAYGRHVGWVNVVTGIQQSGRQPPTQCRGALLADDMGLGKTISIISLIAATLEDAIQYAKSPITQPIVKADASQKPSLSSRTRHVPGQTTQATETQPSFSLFEKLQDPRVMLPPAAPGPKPKKEGSAAAKKRLAVHDRFHLVKFKSRATLIVCPLSTVQNWESQIEEHVRKKPPSQDSSPQAAVSSLSVVVYHGNSRTSDPCVLANHDVVITTYSLLGYEFSRQNRNSKEAEDEHNDSDFVEEVDFEGRPISRAENEEKPTLKNRTSPKRRRKRDGLPSPLQAIQWFRIVLDEAHMIKEHTTTQSKAACDLLAERRVCLTGTPLQNSLNDLFSLVCFLRLEPFTDRSVWSTHIGTPARLGEPLGVSRLQLIMRHIALRRTKQSSDKHGKPILTLPPKKDDIIYLELDQAEKEVYSKYHQRSRNTFMSLKKDDKVLKNYCSILQELLRLRQICAHVGLVFDSEAQSGKGNDLTRRIELEGFSKYKAMQLLTLMRDTGATQCCECGKETISASTIENEDDLEDIKVVNSTGLKRAGRKKTFNSKKTTEGNKVSEEADNKETQLTSVLTKCQHLFCPQCFRERMLANVRRDESKDDDLVECSVCSQQLTTNIDIAEVSAAELQKSIRLEEFQNGGLEDEQLTEGATNKTRSKKRQPRQSKVSKGKEVELPPRMLVDSNLESNVVDKRTSFKEFSSVDEANKTVTSRVKQDTTAPPALQHGTKITQLILDLLPFSRANPASANFAPHDPIFNQESDPNDPEADYKPIKGAVVKSVVFSQWTKLLDKIAIALDEFNIEHRKLDGTMNRAERNRSMDVLKTDPKVEVLLVSLRAGGVGLNLTCAQRVYLMEPFWNPAVENQAVDRVHRLGQTKPVRMIRYIISGSVEQNMLEIQKRKTELANMSLGQTLSKAELAKRRVEDLHILFKENINSD